jgi:hypothetical protein
VFIFLKEVEEEERGCEALVVLAKKRREETEIEKGKDGKERMNGIGKEQVLGDEFVLMGFVLHGF